MVFARKLYELDPESTAMPWLESSFTESYLKHMPMTQEQRAMAVKYAQDGYVIVDCGMDNATLDRLSQGLKGHYHKEGGGAYASADRIQDAWRIHGNPSADMCKSLAGSPPILDALRFLYRREPIPFQTLNFSKGTQQWTHSDTIHFHSIPKLFMCGVWVALEDIHPDAGPLHYYPGSHRLPVITLEELGLRAMHGSNMEHYLPYEAYTYFLQHMIHANAMERKELVIRKGQALIWSANLLHGGSPVKNSALSRHSQVTHYFFEDTIGCTPLTSEPGLGRWGYRPHYDLVKGHYVASTYGGYPAKFGNEQDNVPCIGAPVEYPTDCHVRVLVWPNYHNERAFDTLIRVLRVTEQQPEKIALCLRVAPGADPAVNDVIRMLSRSMQEAGMIQNKTNLVILPDNIDSNEWRRFGKNATCTLQLGCEDALRMRFLQAVKLPVFDNVEDLYPKLRITPKGNQVGY